MCGIAGVAGRGLHHHPTETLDELARSTARLTHRGPDAGGTWVAPDGSVALGHRRLSIIDLTAGGAQPMTSRDGRHVICFNGEIYNHADLRADLVAAGEVLHSDSDTEVLLVACRRWGPIRTVRRVRGMFAFAYVDLAAGELWLVRDRFGEKPLYWDLLDGTLRFASELKALVGGPRSTGDLDRRSLAAYLVRGAVPQPATIWEGISQVRPGTALRVALSATLRPVDLHEEVHWDAAEEAVRATAEPFTGSLRDAVDEVHDRLRTSVSRSLVSDRPIGCFLSGGVDSTVVTTLAQQVVRHPVRTFTIGFEDARFDESAGVPALTQRLGTEHVSMQVGAADVRAVIPDLATMYDEPLGDSSQLPTHLVARLARADVTVALSGDGGDEVFGGYNRHITAARNFHTLSRIPRQVRGAAGSLALRISPGAWDGIGRRTRRDPQGGLGARVHKLAAIADFDGPADLYARLVGDVGTGLLLDSPRYAPQALPDVTGGPAAQFMLADTLGYLNDDILTKVDRAAMATSLETRVPMLDPDVYRLAWSLPVEFKVHGAQGKVVLREVLRKLVPEAGQGPKSGFGFPLADWLRGPLRSWADDLLAPDLIRRQGLLDADEVGRRWAAHCSGQRNHQAELWNVLMLQSWLAEWTR